MPLDLLHEHVVGSWCPAESRLNQAITLVKQARNQYCDVFCLYQLLLQSFSSRDTTQEESEKMLQVQSALSMLEACSHVWMSCPDRESLSALESKCHTLFGLDPSMLQQAAKSKLTCQQISVTYSVMERVLERTAKEVIRFAVPEETTTTCTPTLDLVSSKIIRLQQEVNCYRTNVAKQRMFNATLLAMVFRQCVTYGECLDRLARKRRLSKHMLHVVEDLAISLQSQLLKLRCVELEMLCQTYTAKTMPTLRPMNSSLQQALDATQEKLLHIRHQVSTYEGLDQRYFDLLKEYTKLKQDIALTKSFLP